MDEPLAMPRPRARRWIWRLGLVAVVVVILLYFAPVIAARSGMFNRWVASSLGPIRGTITVGSAELNWFRPPSLHQVEVRDEAGQRLLLVPTLRLQKTLLALVLNSQQLGTIELNQPEATVTTRQGLSDWEHALEPLFTGPASGSPSETTGTILITDGRISLTDVDTKTEWSITPVQATVQIPNSSTALTVKVDAAFPGDGAGRVVFDGTFPDGADTSVTANLEKLPLAAVGALLRRLDPKLQLAGTLTGSLTITGTVASWEKTKLLVAGTSSATDLAFSAGSLGSDRISLKKADLPVKLAIQDGVIQAEKLKLSCDLGEVSVTGRVPLRFDVSSLAEQPDLSLTADIDLAAVLRQLPQTLRLKPGTKLTSGRVVASLRSTGRPDGIGWTGRLFTLDLKGTHEGQALALEAPITLGFAARHSPGSLPVFERFKCQSDFLKLDATGTSERLALNADFDLQRLVQRLGQIVDFGGLGLAGRGAAQITLVRDPTGPISINGTGNIAHFVLDLPDQRSIREADVRLRFDTTGTLTSTAQALSAATIKLTSGTESVEVVLMEPIADVRKLSVAAARATITADLAARQPLLARFVDMPKEWKIGGATTFSSRVRITPTAIEFFEIQADVRDARFSGIALRIVEPMLNIKPTTMTWDRSASRLKVGPADITCPTAGVRLDELQFEMPGGRTLITAKGQFRGDVSRLCRWLPDIMPEQLAGLATGPMDVRYEGSTIRANGEWTISNLVYGPAANPTWVEPSVRLALHGSYDTVTDELRVDKVAGSTPMFAGDAKGRVARLSSTCDLTLAGDLYYEMSQWETRLKPFLGYDVKITGSERRPFRVEGALASRPSAGSSVSLGALGRLRAEASIPWQSVQAFGFTAGAGELKARLLGDGWVRFTPVETGLNQGKLKLEPYVRLEPGPSELALGKGTAIDHAKITPAACARSLGYAAPSFAGVRDVDGEASLFIEGGRIPLADPMKADIWGKLVIHSARATPGPLVQQLNVLLQRPTTLTLPREISVPVRLVNGRIYHEKLEIPLGEVIVTTTGYVGLDGALSLMAETPIPPKWAGRNASLAKQMIKIPIGGTISQPRLDDRALQQELARFLRDTTEDRLRQEIEKGLKKLVKPPSP